MDIDRGLLSSRCCTAVQYDTVQQWLPCTAQSFTELYILYYHLGGSEKPIWKVGVLKKWFLFHF